MNSKQHPQQEIQAAIDYARDKGWRIKPAKPSSHAWGRMYCPDNDRNCRCGEFCISSIWSTPRNPRNHALQIRRVVDGCTASPVAGSPETISKEKCQ